MTETAPLTRAEEKEAAQHTRFFERVLEGCGPLNAAIEVGWSPVELDRRMKDPEFADTVSIVLERRLEGVEETVWKKAREGVRWAAQMVVYNHRSERWKDVRHIRTEVATTLDPAVVTSVKQAMLEMLRGDVDSIAAMQPKMDAIEVTSVDVGAD
jgi:hypothetical protein